MPALCDAIAPSKAEIVKIAIIPEGREEVCYSAYFALLAFYGLGAHVFQAFLRLGDHDDFAFFLFR